MAGQARSMDHAEDAMMEPHVKHLEPAQGFKAAVSKEAPSASRAACRWGFCRGSWDWGANV